MTDIHAGCSFVIVVFMALLFSQSALHKVQDYGRFLGVVSNYRVVPGFLDEGVARAIIVLESVLVVLLAFPSTTGLAAQGLAVLLLIYSGAMAANLMRGSALIDCGCGGSPHQISWLLVSRNLVLSLLAIFASFHVSGPLGGAALLISLLSGICLWLLYNLAGKLIENHRLLSNLRSE